MNKNHMRVGIDLHNIRDGGGVNYITNLLRVADPQLHKFESIHLFGSPSVLAGFPKKSFIVHHPQEVLDQRLHRRILWAMFVLPRLLRMYGCDILYAPGGVVPAVMRGGFGRPFVTISRNMMPFTPELWRLYPMGGDKLRLKILRMVHRNAFAAADAMIYLTESAHDVIEPSLSSTVKGRTIHVIAHGVNHSLFKPQRAFSVPKPDAHDVIEIVYCSRLEPYKHQIEVIEAVVSLWQTYPKLRLTMVGWSNKTYEVKVKQLMAEVDPDGQAIKYLGVIPNSELPALYARSQLKVFASACENLPNTLVESLGSGLPVLSSSATPMPEIAGDACLYFDPASPGDIAQTIDQALTDWAATQQRVQLGIARAAEFTWQRCAAKTFDVLHQVHLRYTCH